MNRILFAAALALAGCTTAPDITAPLDFASLESRAGQSAGYCVEFTYNGCEPSFAVAMATCEAVYGNVMAPVSPMECWNSNDAAAWGCAPVCNQRIKCPGAEEYPSDLWCCPW